MDYPYPTNFLCPLPAFPIGASCTLYLNGAADDDVLAGLTSAAGLVYNQSTEGKVQTCFDIERVHRMCGSNWLAGLGITKLQKAGLGITKHVETRNNFEVLQAIQLNLFAIAHRKLYFPMAYFLHTKMTCPQSSKTCSSLRPARPKQDPPSTTAARELKPRPEWTQTYFGGSPNDPTQPFVIDSASSKSYIFQLYPQYLIFYTSIL